MLLKSILSNQLLSNIFMGFNFFGVIANVKEKNPQVKRCSDFVGEMPGPLS